MEACWGQVLPTLSFCTGRGVPIDLVSRRLEDHRQHNDCDIDRLVVSSVSYLRPCDGVLTSFPIDHYLVEREKVNHNVLVVELLVHLVGKDGVLEEIECVAVQLGDAGISAVPLDGLQEVVQCNEKIRALEDAEPVVFQR